MKVLPVSLVLSAIVFPSAVSAQNEEVRWSALQTAGTERDCGDKHIATHWDIVESGGTLVATSDTSGHWHMRIHGLNADGSGRIDLHDKKGRPVWFELAAGHGPRKIRYHLGYHACIWQLIPE